MCLSSVYRNSKAKEQLLLEDVCTMQSDGEQVILTDIMGVRLAIPGYVKYADLTGGVVIVQAAE